MELIQRTSWLALQITCTRTRTRKHTRGTTPDIVSSTTSSEVQLPSRPSCKRYSVLFSKKETNFRNQLAMLYKTFRYFNFFSRSFLVSHARPSLLDSRTQILSSYGLHATHSALTPASGPWRPKARRRRRIITIVGPLEPVGLSLRGSRAEENSKNPRVSRYRMGNTWQRSPLPVLLGSGQSIRVVHGERSRRLAFSRHLPRKWYKSKWSLTVNCSPSILLILIVPLAIRTATLA